MPLHAGDARSLPVLCKMISSQTEESAFLGSLRQGSRIPLAVRVQVVVCRIASAGRLEKVDQWGVWMRGKSGGQDPSGEECRWMIKWRE